MIRSFTAIILLCLFSCENGTEVPTSHAEQRAEEWIKEAYSEGKKERHSTSSDSISGTTSSAIFKEIKVLARTLDQFEGIATVGEATGPLFLVFAESQGDLIQVRYQLDGIGINGYTIVDETFSLHGLTLENRLTKPLPFSSDANMCVKYIKGEAEGLRTSINNGPVEVGAGEADIYLSLDTLNFEISCQLVSQTWSFKSSSKLDFDSFIKAYTIFTNSEVDTRTLENLRLRFEKVKILIVDKNVEKTGLYQYKLNIPREAIEKRYKESSELLKKELARKMYREKGYNSWEGLYSGQEDNFILRLSLISNGVLNEEALYAHYSKLQVPIEDSLTYLNVYFPTYLSETRLFPRIVLDSILSFQLMGDFRFYTPKFKYTRAFESLVSVDECYGIQNAFMFFGKWRNNSRYRYFLERNDFPEYFDDYANVKREYNKIWEDKASTQLVTSTDSGGDSLVNVSLRLAISNHNHTYGSFIDVYSEKDSVWRSCIEKFQLRPVYSLFLESTYDRNKNQETPYVFYLNVTDYDTTSSQITYPYLSQAMRSFVDFPRVMVRRREGDNNPVGMIVSEHGPRSILVQYDNGVTEVLSKYDVEIVRSHDEL